MKKITAIIFLLVITFSVKAQTTSADSGTFLLHKFMQNIGKETYQVTRSGDIIDYKVKFKYVDRGSPVALKAELKVMSFGKDIIGPLTLNIKGGTSRFSSINDTISMNRVVAYIKVDDSVYEKKLKEFSFPVGGYSPALVQQVLLQYWNKKDRPVNINMIPFGSVQIKASGNDTLTYNNAPLFLNRYTIAGLIWGYELVWTDKAGNIICLITNDAEGDKQEMMREAYEPLLPVFTARAAVYGMQLFSNATKTSVGVQKPIAITDATIIDVINKTSTPDMVILTENGIITKVGKMGTVTIPPDATIISAKGKTVLPGLFDMHAHFEQAEWGPAYLAAGVTTVRDCGNEFDYINAIKNAIDNGNGVGPQILKAGIVDGKGPYSLGIVQADTKEEAIKVVDHYQQNGFVQIKIYSSVKPAIVKVICDEAHLLGLTVTGHIPNGMNLKQGVDSGMNMVNHMQYVYSIMKKNKDRSVNFGDTASIASLKFIKDHGTVIDPTIGVYELGFRSLKDNILDMEPAFYTLPLPLQVLFKNTGEDVPEALKMAPVLNGMKQLLKKLYDQGTPIVAGTDMGIPGYSLDRELELYVNAGLTPAEALQTATIIPARVMKIDNAYGSITEGKQADIIIVNGDPLTTIRDIRNVTTVIKKGKVYDPVQLHQLVGFTK